jgi:16S rRNA (guanine527-N7)-methyltransferase
MGTEDDASALLATVLERARHVGFLGTGPWQDHVAHAGAFVAALPSGPLRLADLGSGGGIPALPVLLARPDVEAVLIESTARRAAFLAWALDRLGLTDRATVANVRAEDLGRDPVHRSRYDVVTARAFGPPARTAECAAGLLRVGGHLIVSEPPDSPSRWPDEGLARVGFGPALPEGLVVRIPLRQVIPEIPRPTRQLVKRPLF